MMGKSGLFTVHLVKMGQIITWWYTGRTAHGHLRPDGPFGEPQVLSCLSSTRGVVVQNEMMFLRRR
ncbi:MAG: hypothetical protein R2695_00605 [Acidimicrobiales bacterium]